MKRARRNPFGGLDDANASFEAMFFPPVAFYGVDGHAFKLNDTVFEARFSESYGDGSRLEAVVRTEADDHEFRRRPLGHVVVEHMREDIRSYGEWEGTRVGYKLVDPDDGHVWLAVGTSTRDGDYPGPIFEFTPRE